MSPMYDKKYLVLDNQAFGLGGDVFAQAAMGTAINFGVTPAGVAKGGRFGLHIVVTTAYVGTMTSCEIWIVTGDTTDPQTLLIGRYFAIAALSEGAHLFIPCPPTGLLQYASMWMDVNATPDAGAMTAWFGPDEDGAA